MTAPTIWERADADLQATEEAIEALRAELETQERRTLTIQRFLSFHDARLGWMERSGAIEELPRRLPQPAHRSGTLHEVARAAVA